MASTLQGKKIAILVADGFEQVELTKPRQALTEAGAETQIVSPAGDKVKGWKFTDWGEEVAVDTALDQADPEQYDAPLLPGGVMNPDKLRMQPKAVQFVKAFFDTGKPVAVICHGPWTLINAGVVRGKRLTSWPALRADLENAGAQWVNEEVVVDHGLMSSRGPDDIPAFKSLPSTARWLRRSRSARTRRSGRARGFYRDGHRGMSATLNRRHCL